MLVARPSEMSQNLCLSFYYQLYICALTPRLAECVVDSAGAVRADRLSASRPPHNSSHLLRNSPILRILRCGIWG